MMTLLLCIAAGIAAVLLMRKLLGSSKEKAVMAEVVKLETAVKDEVKKL